MTLRLWVSPYLCARHCPSPRNGRLSPRLGGWICQCPGSHIMMKIPTPPPFCFGFFLVLFLIPGWILSRNIIVVSQLKEPHESLYCRLNPNLTHLPLVTLAKPITAECPYSRILCIAGRGGHTCDLRVLRQRQLNL